MKFVIHSQYYPPETGAPQARLSELAERLVSYGHEVHVITSLPNYPHGKIYSGYAGLYKFERIRGVFVNRSWIYPTKSVAMLPRLTQYFSFVFSSLLQGAVSLPKVDYFLTESPPLFLGIAGYLLSRIKGAKWIFNISDLWPESAVRLGVIGNGFPLKASERLEAFCYRQAWLVTGQSREIMQGVRNCVPEAPVYHLSNGVDSELFHPDLYSQELHEELGEGAECIAIYAGLHGIAQGLDQILDAARQLNDLEGKLKIVFIGDGPEKDLLMEKARGIKMVKFLPSKKKSEIPYVLASSDIALIPLKTHIPGAVPSKLYEAMASCLPVVLVADGEAAEILEESNAGLTARPGEINKIASALRTLTADRERRRALGENGRRAVLKRFDRNMIVADFVKFLED